MDNFNKNIINNYSNKNPIIFGGFNTINNINKNININRNSNINSNPNLNIEKAFSQFEKNSNNIMNYQFLNQDNNNEIYKGLFVQNSNQNINNDNDFFKFKNND